MKNLNKQSKACACVIQLLDFGWNVVLELTDKLTEWLNINCEEWYYIFHYLDVQEDETPKNPHMHLVFRLLKRARLNSTLNSLVSSLGLNRDAISIDKPTSYERCVQYLVHKNDPDKYQYPHEDVVCSVSRDELELLLEADFVSIDADALITICREEKTYTAICRRIGLGLFRHYLSTIRLLFEEAHPFVTSKGEVKSKVIRS